MNEAINHAVAVPTIAGRAVRTLRVAAGQVTSRAKVLAALRNEFGGHAVRAAEERKEDPDPSR